MAGQKIRISLASINQLSRDSSLNDTMKVKKIVQRHDRICHYCITYKAPSRLRTPHTNETASAIRVVAITKPMKKATYPARHVCKDTIARVRRVAALNRALICTLNNDRSIRGKRVSSAPGIRIRFHREHCGYSWRGQIISIIITWNWNYSYTIQWQVIIQLCWILQPEPIQVNGYFLL